MFKIICKRAVGLVSRRTLASGADGLRRGLAVLMLLVTASVMLNLAAPRAARAATLDVAVALSDYSIQVGETTELTITITNNTGQDATEVVVGATDTDNFYPYPSGVVAGPSPILSDTCGSSIHSDAGAYGEGSRDVHIRASTLAAGATCVIRFTLKGVVAGEHAFAPIGVNLSYGPAAEGASARGGAMLPGSLTVTALPSLASASLSSSSVAVGETADLTVSLTNNSGVDVVAGDQATVAVGLNRALVSYGTGGPLSNSCNGVLMNGGVNSKVLSEITLATGATCTIVFRVTAMTASEMPESLSFELNPGSSGLGFARQQLPLTVAAAPDPTPVLTFTNPITTLFVDWSSSSNGATSTVNGVGSGAITYVSSDPGVVSVDPVTGIPTGVSAGTVTITATQAAAPGVNAQGTASYNLLVKGTPTATSMSPTTISTEGGETVVLLGVYFTNITQLYTIDQGGAFHAVPFNLVGDGELNFATPAAPGGNLSVRIGFGGGDVVVGALNVVAPEPRPTVASVSPASGPLAGGSQVTITGTGFNPTNGALDVRFGAASSGAVYVLNDTTIQTTSPAGTGIVDVTVTTAGGTSATSAGDQFTYVPAPTLTSLDKTFGAVLGGSIIQIQGADFTAASTVTFGGAAASVTFVDAQTLSVVSPSHSVGQVDVVVTDNGQVSNALTYVFGPPPSVAILDAAGMLSPTEPTTISAIVSLNSLYQDPVQVTVRTVDGTAEAARDFVSRQATITFQPGETAKPFDVEILPSADYYPARAFTLEIIAVSGAAVSDGSAIVRIDNPNPSPAPTVTGLDQTSGLASGAAVVTLTGTNFTGATAVMFGGVPAPEFQVISATEIRTVSPAGAEGVVDVTVTTPDGTSALSEADQFTYLPVPDPTPELTFATPGPASVILGLTLTNVATSTINGAGAGAVTYASDDTRIATVDETTGVVTPVSVGATTIFAVQADVAGVNAQASAAFDLVVTAPPAPPAIEGRSLTLWTVGLEGFQETLVATGGLAPLTFTVVGGGMPGGLTLDAATGVLSGTPTEGGKFVFEVQVADRLGRTGRGEFVIAINGRVAMVTSALAGGIVGQPYQQEISAQGGTGALTFGRKGALPEGLVLDPATGIISGVPTEAGSSQLLIYATDELHAFGGRLFTLVVEAGIPSAGPVTLSVAFGSRDNPVPLDLSGPPALAIEIPTAAAHGVVTVDGLNVTYTPTAGYSGPDSFTYTARGAGGLADPATVSLSVAAPPSPQAEAVTVNVSTGDSGGSAPIDLSSAVSNAVGVTIITGPVHGTVTVSGFVVTYTPHPGYFGPDSFTYRAVGLPGSEGDAAPAAMSASFSGSALSAPESAGGLSNLATVSISVSPPTLTMSPATASSASVGMPFSQTFAASGGTAPYHDYRIVDGALPAGLVLSAEGRLTGAPTAGGTFDFTIAATDSSTGTGPFTASRAYSLTVDAPGMSLSPGVLPDGVQGVAYSPVAFAGQGATAPYSFSLAAGALPAGLTLSGDGLLSGTPTRSGAFSVTIRATDSSTGSGPFTSDRALTLVIGVPPAPSAAAAALDAPFNTAGVGIDVAELVSGLYSEVGLAAGPAHGSVVRQGTRFIYTPTPGYYGPDIFSYTASGYGGTSAPGVVSVTVATPAPVTTPKSAATPANASVEVAVTSGDSGPIASIAITQAPAHGAAVINGLVVIYTPATNYFGADSFSYTATGAGGTSAPAVVSLTVSPLPVPASPARTTAVVSGESVVLDATTGAAGGPFTGLAIVEPPVKGTATVAGQRITYAAPAGYSGTTSFTYALDNPFGTSAPILVTVTVNPMPVTAGPITVTVPADGSGSTPLTTGAAGGPFRSAAIVSLSPADSGTVAISEGSNPSGPTFTLTFTAARRFSGPATVTYTLTNAFATSAPGTIVFEVQARADPTLDPDVRGLVAAQADAAIRFATAQMGNFNQRLESRRDGPGRSNLAGVNFNFGDLIHRGDESDPFALRDRQLGRQDADVAAWGIRPATPIEPATGFQAAGAGGAGDRDDAGISLWTGGTIDMGLRRSKAGLSKLDFTTEGVSLGADVSLTDRLLIGAGTGYSSDSTAIGANGSRSAATSYVGVLYGAYHAGDRTYLEMVLGYGEMSFESKRVVPVNGLTAYGERDGRQLFASLTAAFEQRSGPLTWTPYGRVAMVSADLDAFTETGGGVGGLTFHRQDIRSLKGVAGLTSTYVARTRYGLLTPALRLEYAYEFEGAGTYSLNYADWAGGPVYSAASDTLERGRMTIGVGADLRRGAVLFGIEYRGGVGSDEATTSQVSARMSVTF